MSEDFKGLITRTLIDFGTDADGKEYRKAIVRAEKADGTRQEFTSNALQYGDEGAMTKATAAANAWIES